MQKRKRRCSVIVLVFASIAGSFLGMLFAHLLFGDAFSWQKCLIASLLFAGGMTWWLQNKEKLEASKK